MSVTGLEPARFAPPPRDARVELRQAAHALEAVFLAQLFRAMRATVPTPEGGEAGGALFGELLDDRLAAMAGERMVRGLGDALYRQLSRRLGAGEGLP